MIDMLCKAPSGCCAEEDLGHQGQMKRAVWRPFCYWGWRWWWLEPAKCGDGGKELDPRQVCWAC